MAGSIYLADTSVLVLRSQYPTVAQRCDSLLLAGRLAMCHMTALEYLNIAPGSKEYERLFNAISAQRWMDVTTSAMNEAMQIHRGLAQRSQHRNFRLPDLIIAATAAENGATVLHYDADFDRISAVSGHPCEWVVPKGSL